LTFFKFQPSSKPSTLPASFLMTVFMTKIALLLGLFSLSTGLGCSGKKKHVTSRVIVIQPFSDINPLLTDSIFRQIKQIGYNVYVRPAMALPTNAFYSARGRYRADSLIRLLRQLPTSDTVVIGLTEKDISTTKGQIQDWGVMGLGYCPGTACVVSTYRLSKKNLFQQFHKVALHELGHTQGLEHCADKTCFMRDAEGDNPLNEEKGFCSTCKTFLTKHGWTIID